MSILLYVVGAIAVAIGSATIAHGVPINEFSFGNTLIIAGTVAVAGGLIVLALGVVAGRLQTLIELQSRGAPVRPAKPADIAEPPPQARVTQPRAAAPSGVPFPAKPKAPARPEPSPLPEPPASEPIAPAITPVSAPARAEFSLPPLVVPALNLPPLTAPSAPPKAEEEIFAAPLLPNPDEPPAFDAVEPALAEKAEAPPFEAPEQPAEPEEEAPAFTSVRRSPAEKSEPSYFDDMWPAAPARDVTQRESEAEQPAAFEPPPPDHRPFEPRFELPADVAPEPEEDKPAPREERPVVAILKSGVVDGMGYTLYVDGSIEAELPDGTLRFASINELRAHLERSP